MGLAWDWGGEEKADGLEEAHGTRARHGQCAGRRRERRGGDETGGEGTQAGQSGRFGETERQEEKY